MDLAPWLLCFFKAAPPAAPIAAAIFAAPFGHAFPFFAIGEHGSTFIEGVLERRSGDAVDDGDNMI
jgi:hypothetical protein